MIKGFCHEDFEPVKELFTSNFVNGDEKNAQLCVYVGDELVIDLWGTKDESNAAGYGPDSLQVVYSCGKNVSALVVGMLVDKKLLSYDSKVEEYWPEFGILGKADITLADVLRHEGGLNFLEHKFDEIDFSRENIKAGCVSNWLEMEPAHWDSNPDVSRRAYHAITRGWILNEIVRRVDPWGRTIGEILYQEVMQEGMFCGLPDSKSHLVAPQQAKSMLWLVDQSMLPSFISDRVETSFLDIVQSMWCGDNGMLKAIGCLSGVKQDPRDACLYFLDDRVRKHEHPSANCNGSARGLARVAHIMANNGTDLDGKKIMSPRTCLEMHKEPKVAIDFGFGSHGSRTAFTRGGFNHFRKYKNPNKSEDFMERVGWYGWMGYGGSVMQWHPALHIAFGYAQTNIRWWDIEDKLAGKLQKAVMDCCVARPLSGRVIFDQMELY